MTTPLRQPVFCTACGERLEDFCFSPEAKDLEALRAAAFRCHLEGRHTSGMCAKLYIADDAHPAQPADAAPAPARPLNEEELRKAIMARILTEGDAPGDGPGPSREDPA